MNAKIKKSHERRDQEDSWTSWSLHLWIFWFIVLPDHWSSWSLHSWILWSIIFLVLLFMDLFDHCVYGSSWCLHSWMFLIPALIDLPDPCDQEDQWSERSMNQKIHKYRDQEDQRTQGSRSLQIFFIPTHGSSLIFLIPAFMDVSDSWDCLIINLLDPCVHWSSSSFNQQTLPMLLLLILMITILLTAEW